MGNRQRNLMSTRLFAIESLFFLYPFIHSLKHVKKNNTSDLYSHLMSGILNFGEFNISNIILAWFLVHDNYNTPISTF